MNFYGRDLGFATPVNVFLFKYNRLNINRFSIIGKFDLFLLADYRIFLTILQPLLKVIRNI